MLPRLPSKARPRWDHLGFREQGSDVADERIKALQAEIKTLEEEEEILKRKQDEMSNIAGKERDDAISRNRAIQQQLKKANDSDIGGLQRNLADRFKETESALKLILDRLEVGEIHQKMKEIWQEPGKQSPLVVQKKLSQRKRNKEELTQKKAIITQSVKQLEAELKALNAVPNEPEEESSDSDSWASSRSRPMSPDRDLEIGDEKSTKGSAKRSAKGGDEGHEKGSQANEGVSTEEADHDAEQKMAEDEVLVEHEEPEKDATKVDVRDEASEELMYQQEQQKEAAKLEQVKKDSRKQRQRLEKKEAELHKVERLKKINEVTTKLDTERFKEERCQLEISTQHREIKRLEKELNELKREQDKKKDDKDEESQVENDGEILKRKDTQEFEEMVEQDVREKELREVRDLVLSKRAPHPALRREEREHRLGVARRVRERRPVSVLGRTDRLHGFDALPRGMREFLEPDDSDSTNDEAEDPSRQRFLEMLELMIKGTEDLEAQIRMILEHRERMSRAADMKQILQSEMRLERRWIDHVKAHSTLESGGSCSDSVVKHNHLSGERVTDKITYKDLEGESFRVLILLPAPEPYYPLICKLDTWPLNDRGETRQYAALSYFWGSDGHNGRIYFLGENDDEPGVSNPDRWGSAARRATSVRIRNNLFRALLRLRSHGKGAQKVALWVDFLCINQANSVEKTQQLSRMVNIYNNASNVCIWLGESDRDKRSDEAMAFIPTLMDFAVFDRHANDRKQARKWYALGELMRDRWFSRRWIVQEIALAKDATVHCGGAIVRWSDFADAASLLVSNQETIKSLFDFSDWREGPNTLGDIEAFGASILLEATNNLFLRKHNGEIKRPIKSIESLVTSLKTFDTSDQRDLIYSLKCIASDTSRHLWQYDKGGRDDLPADYSKSEIEVYKDFTEFCVRSSNSLDIICRPWAMPVKGGKALPSWIPLLSSSEFGLPDEIYSGRKNGEVLVGPAGQPNYAASVQEPCNVRFDRVPENEDSSSGDKGGNGSARREVLFARGFRLAKIEDVSARNTGGVITKESLDMGKWPGFGKDTDSVPDPIWRTLVADRNHNGQVPPSWYQRACLRCLEIADVFNNGDLNIGEILQGHSEMLRKYLTRVRNVTWNRRFFSAIVQETEWPLFGLCPPKSREGDFVCILYGCSVPVVMRESGSGPYVTLIGEAYVHGKMDGEALEDFEEKRTWEQNGQVKDEEFAIV